MNSHDKTIQTQTFQHQEDGIPWEKSLHYQHQSFRDEMESLVHLILPPLRLRQEYKGQRTKFQDAWPIIYIQKINDYEIFTISIQDK